MKNEGFKFSVDDTNDYKKGGIEKVIESLGVEYLQTQVEKLTQENNQLKERIEYLQTSISRKEETIIELRNELVETPKETELENIINNALAKITNMFDEGNEETIIDDLLELMKILERVN